MAVTASTRFGLTRWSAGTDPFSRAQLDADHEKIDALAVQYDQGALAGRDAPGVSGRFYYATDGAGSTTLTYDDGVAWRSHPHAIGDLPVAASGVSNASQLVRADDSRLSDARPAAAHSHAIADLPVAASGVSSTTQLVRADDARLSNARTPTAHVHSGADITSGTVAIAHLPVAASGTTSTTQLVRADDARLSDARPAAVHVHAAGDITSGVFGIARIPTAGDGVSSATAVPLANDSRLSNARTPTAHSHAIADLPVAASGVSSTTLLVRADDARLSDARTPAAHTHVATTDLTATGTKDATTFLRGDNTWAPAGGGTFEVRVATTGANLTLSGLPVVDDVQLAIGDFALVKDQTSPTTNGVYVVASGAWTRHPSFATSADVMGSVVAVRDGTTNRGAIFRVTDWPSGALVSSTPMYWTPLASGAQGGRESAVSTSPSGSVNLDCRAASVFWTNPTGSVTYALVGAAPGIGSGGGFATTITVIITQPSTLRSITWPAGVAWLSGAAPTQVASKVCIATLMTVNGGTTWYASATVEA